MKPPPLEESGPPPSEVDQTPPPSVEESGPLPSEVDQTPLSSVEESGPVQYDEEGLDDEEMEGLAYDNDPLLQHSDYEDEGVYTLVSLGLCTAHDLIWMARK